ncbi:MAG: hypothetical protein U9R06_03410 [Patescibacteria group bacterium]|nr:hypothetical protein [Patescibacteria group bacterium]
MKKINYQNYFLKLFVNLAMVMLLFLQTSVYAFATTENSTISRQPKKAETKTAVLLTQFNNENKNTGASEFPVQILVNPGGQAINAVGIDFNFDQNILEAARIDFNSSFCTLFIKSWFDNKAGQIQIACGKPYPGISEEKEVATIYFRLKNSGWNEFTFTPKSQVLANDGFGTDILAALENSMVYLR